MEWKVLEEEAARRVTPAHRRAQGHLDPGAELPEP